jgi:hypothetical protein
MKTKPTLLALALSIVTLCVIPLLPSWSNAQAVKLPPAEQYKVVGLADDDPALLEAKLNKLAGEGWSLRTSFTADQFRGLILAK